MQYVLTPHAKQIEPWAWWDGAFSDQELTWLQEKAKNATENAKVGGGRNNNVNSQIRRSQISWLTNTPETQWVFDKFANVVTQLNAEHFRLELTGFGEPFQLTNYDQSENGMYGWHQDFGRGISRKLSLAMQLSNPSDYEGGNFQIFTGGNEPQTLPKKRGYILVFPSYVVHQVTPVTQGSRQSLVAWASGPAFK
jgi:PKHD-type hydroxylase